MGFIHNIGWCSIEKSELCAVCKRLEVSWQTGYKKLVIGIDSAVVVKWLKLSSFPRHTLSYAGKVELIKSVVQGMECYWLYHYPQTSSIQFMICVVNSCGKQSTHQLLGAQCVNQQVMEVWE